ncbi:hypothetical protein HY991_05455 [Candidatus Micrarchaeota archaeon]|nr:hypothetical protein [Candidatus Micrarchaeota archaeon]
MNGLSEEEERKLTNEIWELSLHNRKNIHALRQLTTQATEEKKLRDEENQQVLQLKEKRNALQEELKKVKAELEEKENKLREYENELELPYHVLKKAFDEVEWRIQTESSPRREKELSKESKKIEKQLKKAEEFEPIRKEAIGLRKRIQELAIELKTIHTSLLVHAKESDVHHEKLLSAYKAAEELQQKIVETLAMIDEKRTLLGKEIPVEEEEPEPVQEKKELKEPKSVKELAKRIMADFKSGKPISEEELHILQNTELE